MSNGKLYVVSTPIGNMRDLTMRALDVLNDSSVILAEDTRETVKILKEYNIDKPLISYRDQNHERVYSKITDFLSNGHNVSLTTDNGTPAISDPGFKLIRDLVSQGFDVVSVPGATALIAALSVSGLPTDKFTFLGFLPKSSGQKENILKSYGQLDSTLVIYESPFRLEKLLNEIKMILGDRYVCIVKDITKQREVILRGNISEVFDSGKLKGFKGEIVVLVSKEGFSLNG